METLKMKTSAKKPVQRLAIWTFAWVASTAIATFGPDFIWNSNILLSGLFIGLNFLVGIGMILANIHHITSLDEMMQKIQLEAMGITLGITLIAGIAYSMLDTTNVISGDAEISFLIILMGLTYIMATVMIQKKYK